MPANVEYIENLFSANLLKSQTSTKHVLEVGIGSADIEQFNAVIVGMDVVYRTSPSQAARHLLQSCRAGGRISIACAAPSGFLAGLQQLINQYLPRSSFAPKSGFLGTRECLNEHFGPSARALGASDRILKLRYTSLEHWLARWHRSYAPLKHAYRLMDAAWRNQFSEDVIHLAKQFTQIDADGRYIHCEYLEFLVHKRDVQ